MDEPYRSNVELYDRIHDARGKDYAQEAARVGAEILARHPTATTLLDAACGTGRHLAHLSAHFRCTGLDLSEPMLAAARLRVPAAVDLHRGDLRTFDLGRRFDAITCLFSSIGYLRPLEEMRSAIANLAHHLAPGGVLVVEPWIIPDRWMDGAPFGMDLFEGDGERLVRMTLSERTGHTTSFEMHYLSGSADGVDYLVEHHVLEMYTFDEYVSALESAGLETDLDVDGLIGRGLVIGVRL